MEQTKKMGTGVKVLLVILAVVIVAAVAGVSMYNSLVNGEAAVENAFANIDVQLQRRNDLIPNLVSTVKGYAAHEEKVISDVTDARAKMMGAGSIDEKIAADGELSGALGRLFAITEAYPDLKASENFLTLQSQLEGTENRIAVSRKDYNDSVMDYNRKLRAFPTNLVAGMFGFEKYNAFTASPDSATPPVVGF